MIRFPMLTMLWRKRRLPLLAVAISFGAALLFIGAIDSSHIAATLASAPRWLSTTTLTIIVALFALCVASLVVMLSMVRRNQRISAALDNMTQGLCMFDESTRLIICNEPYLEMYGLTREYAYPGCPLRD